jgi:hypothetical protein
MFARGAFAVKPRSAKAASVHARSTSDCPASEHMGDQLPKKRLKIKWGSGTFALAVDARLSVKATAEKVAEDLAGAGGLGKRTVRTFLLPDEVELVASECIADVVHDEILWPVFVEEGASERVCAETQKASLLPAAGAGSATGDERAHLTVKWADASGLQGRVVKVANSLAALQSAILKADAGALFSSNGIELSDHENGIEQGLLARLESDTVVEDEGPTIFVVMGKAEDWKPARNRFGVCEAWQPPVAQSNKAMAAFLSTLHVVTTHSRKKASTWLRNLEVLMPFPPALIALSALFDGETISPMQQRAISSALFWFITKLLPDHFDHSDIFSLMPSVSAFLVGAVVEEGQEKELLSKFFMLHQQDALFGSDAVKFLRIIPALRIRDYRDVPCLIEHDSGGLAVFCGIPGCSVANIEVFLPLKDKHVEIDPQMLAKRLAELGKEHTGDGADVIDNRRTKGEFCTKNFDPVFVRNNRRVHVHLTCGETHRRFVPCVRHVKVNDFARLCRRR